MPQVLDIEQIVLLLELEPPFDKRDIQLARRRLAKQWHPDIAPPGRQHEHERHLKAINEAADQLVASSPRSRAAGASPRTRSRSAPPPRASAAPRRARAPTPRSSASARRTPTARSTTRSPRACPTTRSCTATRAACRIPSGASAACNGIYFTGDGDDVQQWARVSFQPGIRTVPAGSLQFVDFSKPDPGAERVQRFMTAAKHALAEGDFKLAARRLVFARDAEPANTQVLRLMTLAFWQAGDYSAAGRVGARLDPGRARAPGAVPLRGADLRGHGRAVAGRRRGRARDGRGARATPRPGSGWAGCGCGCSIARARARRSSARARPGRPSRGCSTSRWSRTCSATSAPRSRPASRRRSSRPESEVAWARYAHALARTDRVIGLPRGVRPGAGAGRRSRGARPARPGRADGPARATSRVARAPAAGTRARGSAPRAGRSRRTRRASLTRRPVRQPRGQQRAEAGHGEAAAHRAEELDRGGGDADLGHLRPGSGSRSRRPGTSCPCRGRRSSGRA